MDQPKIERLLRLMQYLIANRKYTIDELAERLGSSQRTIYRYLDTFKAAGFVLRKEGDYYSLAKESKYFEDISQLVHFTEEEAYIFNKLLDGLDDNNQLKQRLKKKLASVYNFSSMPDCIVKGRLAENIHALVQAIEEKRVVILKGYSSSHSGMVKDRRVEPFNFTTNYIGVWCYDPEDKKCKVFKSARIESVEITPFEWRHEQEHAKAYMDIFRMTGDKTREVSLELGVVAHNLILEEYPLSERDITKIGNKKWLLKTNVSSFMGVARFYMGLADDIKILEPQELKDFISLFVQENIKY